MTTIHILASVFVFFSIVYFLILILVMFGLGRLKRKPSPPVELPKISIIIAARNEARRIRPVLNSLERLDYPADNYEVIFVDDASTDGTGEMIQSFAGRHQNWRLIRLNEKSNELKGKKKALKAAIEAAEGELIFTTDADCRVPPNWLKIMSRYFDEQTAMVLGHSPLRTARGLLSILLKFDNLFSAIVCAAPAALGFPHTSVGRNLAYRKSIYMKVGGFDALKRFRSGDDVHLTELFRRSGKGKIVFCADPETFVDTLPHETLSEIFNQQLRKNSKTFSKSLPSLLFSLVVLAIYLFFIFLPFLTGALFKLWLSIILLKLALEFFALVQTAIIFKRKQLIPWLPLMQLFYPFYILVFGFLGSLQIYQWKK